MSCPKHEKPIQPATAMPSAASASTTPDLLTSVAERVAASTGSGTSTDRVQPGAAQAGLDNHAGNRAWTTAERREVVERLLDEHFDRVFRYAFYLSGCSSVAEDVAQEVFLRAFRSIHQLRDQQAGVGWLLTIARNEFTRYCQARKATVNLEGCSAAVETNDLRQIDSQDWVRHALDQLPAEFRVVVLMFYFEEKSYAEIAAELQLPLGTVMSRLSRARGHLKHALEQQSDAQLSKSPKVALARNHP